MTRSRIFTVILVLSITFNLIFIGGIATRIFLHQNPPQFQRPLPPGVSWLERSLSEHRRIDLQSVLQQNEAEIRQSRQAMAVAQRQVNALLRGGDFEASEFNKAYEVLRQASLGYQQISHENIVSIFEKMSPEERINAAEFVQRRGPRGPGSREGRLRDGRSFRQGPRPDNEPPPPPPADQ